MLFLHFERKSMEQQDFIRRLSRYLFWDIDLDVFDVDRHSSQLIQRVLEYGTLDDWRLTRDYYGIDRVVSDCKKLRNLNPFALSFVCLVSGTKKEDYRCYHFRQSAMERWNF